MPSQSLIHESVIRSEQIHHTSVFLNDTFNKKLYFFPESSPQIVVEIWKELRIRICARQIPKEKPLTRKILDKSRRSRILQHTPHLLLQNLRFGKLAAASQADQHLVRNAAPEPKRQARCEFEIAHAIRCARFGPRRFMLGAKQKLWIHQNALESELNSRLESFLTSPLFVESHQRLNICGTFRSAVGAASQPGHNLARAYCLVLRTCWTACKNLASAWRISRAARIERSRNS